MTAAPRAAGEPSRAHVDALQEGDQSAWRAVVGWLQPQLDGFYLARGAHDHEALTQETLLRMSRHIARFVDGGAHELRAWAFAIARTVQIDDSRRAAARPQTTSDAARGASGDSPDPTPAADEQIAAIDRVERLFTQLTSQQAELLRLRIHGDLTLELAARTLGMDLAAAKQMQRRALRRLQTLLAEEAVSDVAPSTGDDDPASTAALVGRPTSGSPP